MSAAHRPMDPAVVVARKKENVLVGEEIVRHNLNSRIIHWSVAVTFFVSLFTGMPIWTPLFGWMAAFFGGLSVCRVIHPGPAWPSSSRRSSCSSTGWAK